MNVKMELAVDELHFCNQQRNHFLTGPGLLFQGLGRYAGTQWSTSALEAALATSRSMPEKPGDLLAAFATIAPIPGATPHGNAFT
jgi:hypothetical protein